EAKQSEDNAKLSEETAIQKALEASQSADSVSEDRIVVEELESSVQNLALQVTNDKQAVSLDKQTVLNAKTDIEDIRDNLQSSVDSISSKVNISDVQDLLTSTDSTKPLSANQGRILEGFIKQNKNDLQNLSVENIAGLENLLINQSIINKPVIISPANLTADYIGAVTSTYNTSSTYEGLQTRVIWECALDDNFNDIVDRYEGNDNLTSWTPSVGLALTQVFIRTKQISDGHRSDFSDTISFTTPNIFIQAPTISISGNLSGLVLTPTISLTAFSVFNGSDTHISTDYQAVNKATGVVKWESLGNTVDKLEITTEQLDIQTEYTFRARFNGQTYGSSSWVEIDGTTVNIYVENPILTVAGTPDSVTLSPTMSGSAFNVINGAANHISTDYRAVKVSDNSVVFESLNNTSDKTSIQITGLEKTTEYKFMLRYNSDLYGSSDWIEVVGTTLDIYVVTPTLTVSGQPLDIGKNPTLTTSAFTVYNGSDTHLSSDYQVLKNSDGSLVWESLGNTSNKLTINSGDLVESEEYRFRARHNSTNYGSGAWVEVIGTTKSQFTIPAGVAGTKGFSVAPTDQPFALLGLAEMTGTNEEGHDNYGNYIHTNGSIVCWLPKTFYRVGHSSSPRFATYGANALDIVGADTFSTEEEANTAGYALHRAFINAGKEQSGFFIDKYMNSKDGTTASKSVFGGVPISLATTATYTNSNGMTGCTGILADAVVLSKARGERWNTASAFIYGYLALVSVAQAQAATSTADVAWYDVTGVKNYPKGCNNGALSDVDDTTVVYASAGDSGNANKPKTGAIANFPKTTHNGSNNGVADLNGGMYEVTIGITNFGSSATATTAITNDTIYVLKHSVDVTTLTAGWNGATDVWGDAANLATKYDSVTSPHPLGSSTGTVYWGNSTNAVLQNDLNGVNRDVCGFIPKNSNSTGATGANLFGNDYLNKNNRQNMMPYACGRWDGSAGAGVFDRSFLGYRSAGYTYCGFRASAYFA
ncbi:hypothetical protein, partial [Aliarcobacter butzleri]|uniref:hypothetical protein n=1 Tax=Aliarcobacter butzleri TaxID=28197 RepID=UPI00062E396A